MPTTRTRRIAARLGVLAAALALTGTATAAISIAQTDERAPATAENSTTVATGDLKITASLDKFKYATSQEVNVSLLLTNTGDEQLRDVQGYLFDDPLSGWRVTERDEMSELNQGLDLAAGESFAANLTGYATDNGHNMNVEFDITTPREDGLRQSTFVDVFAEVVQSATHSGTVYADRNYNGAVDTGEELADVAVKLEPQPDGVALTETTDKNGRFAFTDIVPGEYMQSFALPAELDGWSVDAVAWTEITSGEHHTEYRALIPLRDQLEGSVEFQADSYRPDDTVDVTVTLTNVSEGALSGITANCGGGRTGDDSLKADNAGWGPLQEGADGVSLEPGETKVVKVTDTIPDDAVRFEKVLVMCTFVITSQDRDQGPYDHDAAQVIDGDDSDGSSSDDGSDEGSGSDKGPGSDDDSGSDGDGSGAGDGSDGGSASGGSSDSAEDDLALTGFGGMEILWIGLLALAGGAAALWYARRRRTSTETSDLG